jgi:hypothetical protein
MRNVKDLRDIIAHTRGTWMNTTANQILSPMNYSDRVSKIEETNNILKKSF